MSFPPEFHLIGAQKAGTTSLAYLLSQHPDICIARTKESHFFTTYLYKGLDWYKSNFANYENSICLDASTTYAMAPLSENNSKRKKGHLEGVPQRIQAISPHAKFIYLLREPIARTYSAYWHYFNIGCEGKNFREAIKNDSFYLDVSNYYGQLNLWLKYFPLDSFFFVLFEDMKRNPARVAEECFQFMGVNPENVNIKLEEAKNQSRYVNFVGRQCNRLFFTLDMYGHSHFAPSILRKTCKKLTTDNNKKIPPITETDKLFLSEYFAQKNHQLACLTGLSLDSWQVC